MLGEEFYVGECVLVLEPEEVAKECGVTYDPHFERMYSFDRYRAQFSGQTCIIVKREFYLNGGVAPGGSATRYILCPIDGQMIEDRYFRDYMLRRAPDAPEDEWSAVWEEGSP